MVIGNDPPEDRKQEPGDQEAKGKPEPHPSPAALDEGRVRVTQEGNGGDVLLM